VRGAGLRCGACGHERRRTLLCDEARRLKRVIEFHQNAIAAAANRLACQRMAGWAEAFITALQHDLIDAAGRLRRTTDADGVTLRMAARRPARRLPP
jgi:hypothetical protein